MINEYRQLLDGVWCDASNGKTWDVIDPSSEDIVVSVPFGDRGDCRQGIEAASRAFPTWAAKTPWERAAVLVRAAALMRERADAYGRTTVAESGKPLVQAKGEWLVAADLFEWFAEEGKRGGGELLPSRVASKRMSVMRQPLGVVGVITAWNFPAYNPARAWAAALAAGCTVVARPSEYTPLTAMLMAGVLLEAGLPPGVLNLVNGDPEGMGQELLDHPACRKISFTGSVRVGKLLMDGASRTVTRLSLELGGNAPVVVFPDVDVDQVAAGAVSAKFRNGGQVCIAPQRFLVHRSIIDRFVEQVVGRVGRLRLGNGLAPDTQVGPLINARQRDRVEALVTAGRAEGASVLVGGGRPREPARGFYYQPTVLTGVEPRHAVFHEEIFGPVMPVLAFDDAAQAVALANATPYGLAAYLFTRDLNTAVKVSEALHFGMIGVNEWNPHATEAPFGGAKQSGVGHESGTLGLREYQETKLVSIGGL